MAGTITLAPRAVNLDEDRYSSPFGQLMDPAVDDFSGRNHAY